MPAQLKGRKVAFLATDGVEQVELTAPWNALKQAGAENLKVTLYSSTAIAGMLESATIFAQQAKKAGVTVNVNNGPPDTYFAAKYLKWAFGQTNWPAIPIPNWINESLTTKAFYNETHWKRPGFDRLVLSAQAERNEAKAKELWFEVQKVLYDQGGYMIWGFAPFLDGVSKKIGATAFPLQGQGARLLGAVGIFWEQP